MRIVFYGTPLLAAENLKALHNAGFNIVAVVTTPDKPAGRGLKLKPSPVKETAQQLGIPVLQPQKLKDPKFIQQLKQLNPDLQVVVAFKILPKEVWQLPPLGTINLHFSYLPQYRGAAPINWVIINGEKETGVTTFYIDEKVDTGKIILRKKVPISDTETAGQLHDKLLNIGKQLLIDTIKLIQQGKVQPIDQKLLISDNQPLKTAPKLTTENTKIDWNKTTLELYNFIRGLSPYPVAWTTLTLPAKKQTFDFVKIFYATPQIQTHNYKPGTIIKEKNKLKVATKDGFLYITELQLPGKKKITAEQFLAGYNVENAFFQ